MKYLRIIDGNIVYPYQPDQLRKDYPNTSFPERLTDSILLEYSIYVVNLVNIQSDYTKNYSEGTPVLIEDQYYQNWIVTDATQEEIDQRLQTQWIQVRYDRNQYLQECDWTQLSDSPLTVEEKAAWATYRQELRDVTLQPDPFNITWPTKP
jgi:hypothetical protein